MKNVYFFINHSLGEIDTLFPLIQRIKKNNETYILIFTVKEIFKSFKQNQFYNYFVKKYNIRIKLNYIPNKFDDKDNYFNKIEIIYFNIVLLFRNGFFLNLKYSMFEFSIQRNSTILIRFLSKIFKKNIYIYQHGQSLNQIPKDSIDKEKLNYYFLLFNKINFGHVKNRGFHKMIDIGFPKFYEKWISFIRDYSKYDSSEKIITIFTREPFHKYYLTPEIYNFLFKSSYNAIREIYGNIKIVIKPHPRADLNYITNIITSNNLDNIVISNEHAGVLCVKSELTIHFWCSTVMDSLAFETPTIEYFIEPKNFRELEPKGSLYKYYGIDSTDNSLDLKNIIKKIKNKKYKLPKIVNDFKKSFRIELK